MGRAPSHPDGPAAKEATMKLKEIVTRDVATVRPEDTLFDAARKMRAYDVGALPVCQGERLIAIVTDRDLAIRAVAEGLDPKTARVRDVMSGEFLACKGETEVKDAAKQMLDRHERRVVVVDADRRPLGVVSLRDLALVPGGEALAGEIYAALSLQSAGRH
jgi:CBS domain-containing protein